MLRRVPNPLFTLASVTALLVSGCGGAGSYDETPSDPGAVEAVLSLRWDTAAAAFATMTAGSYEENRLLDVWRPGGEHALLRTAQVHENGEVVQRTGLDSSGNFRSSWTERLIAPSSGLAIPFDHWLDGEPVYQSPRRRDDYRFETLADTLFGAKTVRRYRVTARDAGQGGLQAVTFMTAGADNQIVGLNEQREERAPFFKQASILRVLLTPSDSTWIPDLVVLDVTVDPPGRDAQQYSVTRRFTAR